MDRQAQKVLTYGLAYGANPKSMFTQAYIEEFAKMAISMAVARYSGFGHLCLNLESIDFSEIEARLMLSARELKMALYHDETQYQVVEPDRHYSGQTSVNQRGRHWERKRKEAQVKVAPKTAQQLLDEDFANDSPSSLVHKLGSVADAPHRKSIACQVVSVGGKLTLQYAGTRWFMDASYNIEFVR